MHVSRICVKKRLNNKNRACENVLYQAKNWKINSIFLSPKINANTKKIETLNKITLKIRLKIITA